MAKLIELNEAAAMLGVSPDELNEMRSRNEIFGYRDGASWKFKQEEIDRVKEELAESSGGAADADEEFGLAEDDLSDRTIDADASDFFGDDEDSDLEDSNLEDSDLDDNSESILVSEEELGESERSTSSTIIGKTDDDQSAGDSDLRLADDDEGASTAEKSDIQLSDDAPDTAGKDPAGMSDLDLADDDDSSSGSDITSGSDIGLSGGSDVDLDGSDLGLAGSSILGGGSDKASGSDLSLDDDDDEALELSADGDDDLELGEDLSLGGSDISLDDDDGELVLDGGSDVTLSGDSGINLSMPTDSGLSLEDEPMELSGSGISSLELPEDDEEDQVISLEEEEADPEAATQLKADNDFMLTPVEGDDDDPSDSGSQVIALDTEELDPEEATQLGMAGGGSGSLFDDVQTDDGGAYETQPGGAPQQSPAYAGAEMVPAELPESPYSIWQVMSLFIAVLLLTVGGMLMMDVIRNMWSFDQPYAANTAIMDMILDAVGQSK